MRQTITGVGFIISGSIGIALGNLEETIFYTSDTSGNYPQSPAYYMFWAFLLIGIAMNITKSIKKRNYKKRRTNLYL